MSVSKLGHIGSDNDGLSLVCAIILISDGSLLNGPFP